MIGLNSNSEIKEYSSGDLYKMKEILIKLIYNNFFLNLVNKN